MKHYICLVPTCPNTWRTAPEKTFVYVSDRLKRRWCVEHDFKYVPKNCFCCENHLNLKEDLKDYRCWTLMNGEPVLKSTANLLIDARTLNRVEIWNVGETVKVQDPLKLQTKSIPKNTKPDKLATKSHMRKKVNVSLQCKVSTAERSTHKVEKTQSIITTKPPLNSRSNRFERQFADVLTQTIMLYATPDSALPLQKRFHPA